MDFVIQWSDLAKISFQEEIDFILLKWNVVEVQKFLLLVDNQLEKIVSQPTIGQVVMIKSDLYCLVLSKQTTLYYRLNDKENQIELVLFWNNSKNPKKLKKLIK
ncbi:MAG: type II toxin-antitoxin system RelE/ParE family toxin [Flavobacterium sp.]